jgi:hypothetical protein
MALVARVAACVRMGKEEGSRDRATSVTAPAAQFVSSWARGKTFAHKRLEKNGRAHFTVLRGCWFMCCPGICNYMATTSTDDNECEGKKLSTKKKEGPGHGALSISRPRAQALLTVTSL